MAGKTARKYKGEFSVEVGSSGLRRFQGEVLEEFEPSLRGTKAVAAYDEMRRNDPDVGGILMAIKMIILATTWVTKPGVEDSAADQEAADFLATIMEDMTFSWRDFIVDVCTMFPFGWAWFEIVWKQRLGQYPGTGRSRASFTPSKYDDGRIGVGKLALRGQHSLSSWVFSSSGGVEGMAQRPAPGYQEIVIPIAKSVLFRTDHEMNNPEGYSLLRNAYRPYFMKKNLEEIEVIGADRDMTGVPKIKLPVGATEDDKNAAIAALERYSVDDQSGFVCPRYGAGEESAFDIELMQTPGSKVVNTDAAIYRHQVAIARSVLAQFLTMGQGQVGSYALSRDHRDLFHIAVKGHLNNIQETINRFLVPKIFELNDFPIEKLPTIEHTDIGEESLDTLSQYWARLAHEGAPVYDPAVLNYMRTRAGWPILEEGGEQIVVRAPGGADGSNESNTDANPPEGGSSPNSPAGNGNKTAEDLLGVW